MPFDPTKVIATEVGSATFTFAHGNGTTVAYTYGGVTQRMAITREIFASPEAVCFLRRAPQRRVIPRGRVRPARGIPLAAPSVME